MQPVARPQAPRPTPEPHQGVGKVREHSLSSLTLGKIFFWCIKLVIVRTVVRKGADKLLSEDEWGGAATLPFPASSRWEAGMREPLVGIIVT